MRPPLKWVGGKQKLLEQLKPLLPSRMDGAYFEPFVGGGAMFFDLKPHRAFLSDANGDLINFYMRLRDQPDSTIREAQLVFHEDRYYRSRREFNDREGKRTVVDNRDLIRRAALFLYLNKAGFNGLWRTNQSGEMNTPIGTRKQHEVDVAGLERAASALYGVYLGAETFDVSLLAVSQGDFVYLDPPYWLPGGHTAYTKEGFDVRQQALLAEWLTEIDKRGAKFMLSNSDTLFTRAIYSGWNVQTVYAGRSINSDITKRGKVSELVVRNY